MYLFNQVVDPPFLIGGVCMIIAFLIGGVRMIIAFLDIYTP